LPNRKVLISAYACEPGQGSERGVGWNWALQAARCHEVWVLTRSAARPAIEAALQKSPVPTLHFVYHDVPRPWSLVLKHEGNGGYPHYYAWQLSALGRARSLHAQIGFDLAHHSTYAGFRFPSFLFALGLPYVWGPVGGGDRAPLRFLRTFGIGGALRQLLRDLSNLFARIDPLVRMTARGAKVIVVATPATRTALPPGVQEKTVIEFQSALRAGEVAVCERRPHDGFRVVYLGRLLYWKGLHLGIRAIAEERKARPDITLTLVATGPEEDRLRKLATRLGLSNAVQFRGEMTRSEALEQLVEHDCLLFPSFQDSGGFAVLEAMAAGLPVVCLDIGGPALSVTDDTGIKVRAQTPAQVVADLAKALVKLAGDESLRRSMGEAGKRRIDEAFLWDRKAHVIDALYERALELSS